MTFSEEEYKDMKRALGEYRRICREQKTSEYGLQKYKIASSILSKLEEIEKNNIFIK
jgi:hypothetical protein